MTEEPICFPQVGVSVDEGTVIAWYVHEGDAVTADQVVCEVSTDKVDTVVVAPADGTIASVLVAAGDTARVGAPLAMVAVDDGANPGPQADDLSGRPTSAPANAQASATAATWERAPTAGAINITTSPEPRDCASEAALAVPPSDPPRWSPVARRIAAERGVDSSRVVGTGRHGRVRKADVLAHVGGLGPASFATSRSASTPVAVPSPHVPPASPLAVGDHLLPRGYEDVPFDVVPTSQVRRLIAEHMSRSRRTAAHVTTEVEVDMHRVTELRAAMNRGRLGSGQERLSFLPFVIRAACSALAEFPDLNATFDDERLVRWREINMAIAVDTERGLLAPVIRQCNEMTLETIADRISELAQRARNRTLAADDMRAGTFTVSNPGSVGAVSAEAIINQPQVAILGMPAIVKRATVVTGSDGEDAIAIRPILLLALTFDHRAVDGAEATRCAVAIKSRLERWEVAAYT